MHKCKHCNSQFGTAEKLQAHILSKHVAGEDNVALTEIPDATRIELGVTKTELDVITTSLAPGATTEELVYFLNAAKAYGLNPVKKEIYFTKMGGKVTPMVSRDGYLKLAHNNPNFRGLHSGTIYEKDTFTLASTTDADGGMSQLMSHCAPSFGDRGCIVGAWARAEVVNGTPVLVVVDWVEYNKKTPIWKQYGAAMIRKAAELITLKRIAGADSAGLVSVLEMADGRYPQELQRVDTTDGGGDDGIIDAEIVEGTE